jgi:hypothetical protein
VQNLHFNDIIAQVFASLTAALGTWFFTDFDNDPSREAHVANEDVTNWKVYSQRLLGKEQESCCNGVLRDVLQSLKGREFAFQDGSKLSEGIKALFVHSLSKNSGFIYEDFARSNEMLNFTLDAWAHKRLRLIVVQRSALVAVPGGGEVFAASTWMEDSLVVYVGMPSLEETRITSDESYEALLVKTAAEALLHEACEGLLSLPHSQAVLAELLLNRDADVSTRMTVQLAWASQSELHAIISNTNRELVRHLSLGIDANIGWEEIPEEVRVCVVSRIKELRYFKNEKLKNWLEEEEQNIELHNWRIRQCLSIRDAALSILEQRSVSQVEGDKINWCSRNRKYVWNAKQVATNASRGSSNCLTRMQEKIYVFLCDLVMFVAIVSTAGTDSGRELWYVLRNCFFANKILWVVLKIWKICWWVKCLGTRYLLLSMYPKYEELHDLATRGASRTLSKGKILVRDPRFYRTGFLVRSRRGFEMRVFDGVHAVIPSNYENYQFAEYDEEARLLKLTNVVNDAVETHQVQTYRYGTTSPHHRIPISKVSRVGSEDLVSHYDEYGRINHGICLKKGVRFHFKYVYESSPRDSLHLLRAT